jgi:V/A-type H+/Na+-transporting ATPase subunit K
MDASTMVALSKAGGAAALGLAAVGSSIGAGLGGAAAIGGWKKCYAQNKAAPFILVTFIGAPLSQTIYGMILMNWMIEATKDPVNLANSWATMLIGGIFGGMGIGLSAWFQGFVGAAGADALAETGQGFGNYLLTLGILETVALFVLVFIRASFMP